MFLLAACSVTDPPSNLALLERSSSPNNALACPPGVCVAQADIDSPTFAVALPVLMETAGQVIAAQPRTDRIDEEDSANRMVFIQRSKVLGFKDTVWVQGIEIDDGSSLIIYSRSNVGYYDFGVNRDRVRSWMAAIVEALPSRPSEDAAAVGS